MLTHGSADGYQHVYGPVSSRRLGRSLGVDIVPFKTCSYDCVYCQLGRTTRRTVDRKQYIPVDAVLAELREVLATGVALDHISFAGSGEPTLNASLGELIQAIKQLTEVPVAVLTNSSLLWVKDVQDSLMAADLVIPSLDAGDERLFRFVNRPHAALSLEQVVEGMAAFVKRFRGRVLLEVLLLAGMSGVASEVKKIANLVSRIGAERVQLNTVTRPPVEDFALGLSETQLLELKSLFPGVVEVVESSEQEVENASASLDPACSSILSLLRRRPCTSLDVARSLGIHVLEALKRLEELVATGQVFRSASGGKTFYSKCGLKESSGRRERKI